MKEPKLGITVISVSDAAKASDERHVPGVALSEEDWHSAGGADAAGDVRARSQGGHHAVRLQSHHTTQVSCH